MTDHILQTLEEKMMLLLTELEDLRKETRRLKQDNAALKAEHELHSNKLQGLISLLDAFEATAPVPFAVVEAEISKKKDEYAFA